MSYNSKYSGAEVEGLIDAVPTKQDKNLYFTNMSASNWVSDSTYADFPYRCDVACSGVTADMFPDVVFGATEAISGDYAPISMTLDGAVRVYSKKNVPITIPTIRVYK